MLPRSFEPVRHEYRFKAFPNFRTVTFIGIKRFRRLRYASLVTCFDRKHNPVFSATRSRPPTRLPVPCLCYRLRPG